jgi:hypothetical protein
MGFPSQLAHRCQDKISKTPLLMESKSKEWKSIHFSLILENLHIPPKLITKTKTKQNTHTHIENNTHNISHIQSLINKI